MYGDSHTQYSPERQEQWQRLELLTVTRLLCRRSNIFRDSAPAVPAQPRMHIDHKRMRELRELRIALDHRPDDHEEKQTQIQICASSSLRQDRPIGVFMMIFYYSLTSGDRAFAVWCCLKTLLKEK